MRVLRSIAGKTLHNRIPNVEIRCKSNTNDSVKFSKTRRKEWNAHVHYMNSEHLPKTARDGLPMGQRPPRRPPKIWAQSWASSSIECPPRRVYNKEKTDKSLLMTKKKKKFCRWSGTYIRQWRWLTNTPAHIQ